jgi:putative ABC transport system permease protein
VTSTALVLANLRRNRLRTASTGAAITVAVLLVTILLTMPAGLDAILETIASQTRISVHNRAGIVYSMPASFTRQVRAVDGVAGAMAISWFGGTFEEEGRITFPSFAVESEHIGAVYPDYGIDAQALADVRRYRDGAIVGRQTMQRYGWKVGDRVTLRSTIWPVELDFRIVGEIPIERSPLFWMNEEYLDQALVAAGRGGLGQVGIIWARAADPSRVDGIMRTIDELSRNSEAETECETEKSFFSSFLGTLQSFVSLLLLVSGLVTLCLVFIAANAASMTVRERAPELAVLKAIGFGRRRIFATLLGETVALSTIAGATGVGLAIAVTETLRSLSAWSPALGPLGAFIVTPGVIVQGLALSLAVGLVAGVAPAWGAARKPVAASLHEVF